MFGSQDKNKPSIEELRAQAIENARAAREHLGEDTIQQIAALMRKKQSSATEQAKRQIEKHSIEDLTRELRYLIDGDNEYS